MHVPLLRRRFLDEVAGIAEIGDPNVKCDCTHKIDSFPWGDTPPAEYWTLREPLSGFCALLVAQVKKFFESARKVVLSRMSTRGVRLLLNLATGFYSMGSWRPSEVTRD